MDNIFILDGQTDEVLSHINKKYVIDNEHERDLPTHKDYFRFTVLAENKHTEHLNKRNGLIVPGEDGELLEFRIFESIKYRNNEGLFIEVHALATYLDLKNQKIFDPHKTNSETALQHATIALDGTEWQVGEIDFKGVRTLDFDSPFNSYDYILRIAREFELEPRFYIKTDGSKITGRYVDLIERIGEFRGRTIEFGRDLQSIERKEDTSEVVTALWVYGPQREDGTRLKVLVEDDEARQRWGRRGQHIIDYYEPQTENQDITEERLKTLGEMELRKRINAVVTYEAEILDLENVPGLENKKIRFGDTIRIKDTKFNPPLYVEARVFNVKRDVFNKSKKTVQLGDYVEYTEEEVKALFRQMQAEIRRRLERLVLVSIISSAGNVFKNGVGSTELTAKTFLSGNEVDEDGTKYEYRWHKFDKNGDYVPGFYEEGKTISVSANTIDEKASFRVEIILDDEVLTVHEITLTNVFDGEDGEPGPPGPKGDKGDPGPQGPPGTSITSIVEYYLATDQSSGVTRSTPGWTTTIQQMTPQKRYLWNYERINFSDGTHQNTNPVVIGVYGDEGEEGRSVVDITEYYLATNASSGVTRSTSGWTTSMQVTTPEKKYLWNYEKITWNKAPLETYTEPVIIGVHGERGPQGPQGPQGIQGPPGQDGQSQYVHIRYSVNSNGNPMTSTPQSDTKYIGLAVTTSPTAPSSYTAYTWSKYRGEDGQDGIPGQPGKDGQPTYTWVKYADDEHGNGMSDSPDGKLYIGLAFNKTTPEESNNPNDYTWSLMPQNIEIGGRNLLTGTKDELTYVNVSGWADYQDNNTNHTDLVNILQPVETYTLRVFLDARNSDYPVSVRIRLPNETNPYRDFQGNWIEAGEQGYSTVTFVMPSDATTSRVFMIRFNQRDTPTQSIGYGKAKLEKGNKATDWTPAPEDVQAEIDEAKQEAEEAKQEAQQAKTTADGKNSVFTQPTAPPTTGRKIGDVWFDTSRDNLMHRFDGTQWVEAKWGEQSIVANSITANHIKSLVGLNVNDQFIVDSNGNVKFAGHLEGATGTFSGTVETARLVVNNPNIEQDGIGGMRLQVSQWQESITKPYKKTGYIDFRTDNNSLEIQRLNESGNFEQLDGFLVAAKKMLFLGNLELAPWQAGAVPQIILSANRTDFSSIRWNANINADYGLIIKHEDTDVVRVKKDVGLEVLTGKILTNSIEAKAGNLFLRPSDNSSEARVATASGSYRPIRASSFPTGSLEEFKKDIQEWEGSALDIINNSTIYEYRLKYDPEKLRYGLVIGEGYNTPEEVIDGDGVEQYLMNSLSWKAIQEIYQILERNGLVA